MQVKQLVLEEPHVAQGDEQIEQVLFDEAAQ